MDEAFRSAVAGWTNFYVIIGSASGALTGLMFVVMTLIVDSEHRSTGRQIAAFGTPTIVQFVAPLVLAAVLTAPWRRLAGLAVLLGILGLLGVAYAAMIIRLARRQQEYRPVLSDWIWFSLLPLVAYAGLAVAAFFLRADVPGALFAIGAVALTLLLLAIRNAWDTVTFVAVQRIERKRRDAQGEGR